jgi:bifunctional dethiobiotin synthetase / adenosylmethionine---8-amino-7-oxononanoate aminotransferase
MEAIGSPQRNSNMQPNGQLQALWDPEQVHALSNHEAVDRVVCLGCVLAAELKVAAGAAGYSSGAAKAVTQKLRARGVYARPLGNVVYLMVTPTTKPETAGELLTALQACL